MIRRRALPALVALGLVAAACGPDSSGGSGDGVADPTTAKGKLTAPGTVMDVGETARVSLTSGAVIDLTITDIERGTSAELAADGYRNAESETPYYVRYEMTLISGDPEENTMYDYLLGWSDGLAVGSLIAQKYPPCQEVTLPPRDVAPGTSVTSCRAFLTDKGAPTVDRVSFKSDADDGPYYETSDNVSWKK